MIVGIGVDIAKIRPAARAGRAGAGPGCLLFAQRERSGVAKALAGPAARGGIRA
jgi:hypothetical protein